MERTLTGTYFSRHILLPVLLAIACGCESPTSAPTKQENAPVATVPIIKPLPRTIRRSIEQPGTVEAFEQTPLFARIAGFVKEIHVDIDDRVKVGQVLAELSVPEMDEELNQKVEAVKQARESFELAGAKVTTAAAHVKEAQAGVQRAEAARERKRLQHERIKDLVAKKALDPQSQEEAWNDYQSAAAGWKEVEAKVETSQAFLKEAEAVQRKAKVDIGAAEADQRRVAALVGYAKIRAPFEGVVTKRNVDTGAFLQPASPKPEPLFVVMRTDKVRVFADVPQSAAPFIRKNTPAKLRISALGGEEFKGRVTRTAWALDPKAFTLRTEIDLPNPEGRMRPGMYAYATLILQNDNALSLPSTALLTQGDQTFCFRVENGKAVRTPIQTGLRSSEFVEVLRKQVHSAKDSEPTWTPFTGAEEIVAAPATVKDGQEVMSK